MFAGSFSFVVGLRLFFVPLSVFGFNAILLSVVNALCELRL